MISKISNWFKNKRLVRSVDGGIIPSALSPVAQEDIRAINNIKSFNKSFDQQAKQIQARALVAHELDCDVISCTKKSCFIWTADKIVRKSTVKMKRIKSIGD